MAASVVVVLNTGTAGPHQKTALSSSLLAVVTRCTIGIDRAGVLHHMYHYDAARMLARDNFVPKAGEFLPAGASCARLWTFCIKVKPATSPDHC